MATVQFSLTAAQVETLQKFSNPGESVNLTAKRVLSSILVRTGTLSNIDNVEPDPTLPTLDTDLTSTEWQLRLLDDRIKTEEYRSQTIAELQKRIDKIEADRLSQEYFDSFIDSLEDRIEQLETEIKMLTTPKQPATPNNVELVIFLADSEGDPIQFWSGQIWADNLDLAYRYKSRQALTRVMDKLKKRKLPGNGSRGTVIAFAPIENLPENGKSWKRF